MSHISGDYNYTFVRLEPFYNNSNETGISALVVGMNCQFSGVDEQSNPVVQSAYIDGTTGFGEVVVLSDPNFPSGSTGSHFRPFNITPEYLTDNISGIANEYASGQYWCHLLSGQISGKIDAPVRDTNFPYPSGTPPTVFPPVDTHDM
jgi:hypothetical protein